MNDTPTGSGPTNPAGTGIDGYPATAAGVDDSTTSGSPVAQLDSQAGGMVGAMIASSRRSPSVSSSERLANAVSSARRARYSRSSGPGAPTDRSKMSWPA